MTQEPSSWTTCPICGAEFASREERNRHAKSEHPQFYREWTKLVIAEVPFIILTATFGIMGAYFRATDPNLATTFLLLLWVEGSGLAYVAYRIYRLPKKYKGVFEHLASK